jgi:alkyl hydroperoxide reductase subunit AhpF
MERLLNDMVSQQVKEVFESELTQPVHLMFFGSQDRCEFCEPTRQLVEELTPLSDKLSASYYDLTADAELARTYRVDKSPSILLTALEGETRRDLGIRYAGMPSGHEFTSLINSIIMVSQRSGGLSKSTLDFLAGVKEDVHLQVFVTPT